MKNKAKEIVARVKETVQTAQKRVMGLEEELNVKERANEISAKVKETVQSAQKQLAGLEDEVQKFVGRVQEKVLGSPADGIKKMDDLLRTMAVHDFVEKVRAIEMFKQGQAFRQDLLERFGLVSADEMATLKEGMGALEKELADLKKKTASLSKRPTGISKDDFSKLKGRIDAMETAAKAKPAVEAKAPAAPKKKPAARKTAK